MRSDATLATAASAGEPILEICVDTLAGARAAIAGGADQIELCSALTLGGLTPSAGLTRAVLTLARPAGVAIRAMVRPCPGGFDYDDDALATAIEEGRALVASGVDGLVFGATRDGRLDRPRMLAWRDAVRPPALTVHRAIDLSRDPVAAVDTVIALGADQLLTSGGATSARSGLAPLTAMADRAAGRCRIVAGAGIRATDVATLLMTGIGGIHASASVPAPSDRGGSERLGFGSSPGTTDEATVRALSAAIRAAARIDASP